MGTTPANTDYQHLLGRIINNKPSTSTSTSHSPSSIIKIARGEIMNEHDSPDRGQETDKYYNFKSSRPSLRLSHGVEAGRLLVSG